MANRVKIRRGLKANLPTLSVGEQALCTDTSEIFLGGSTGNIQLANKEYVDTQLAQIKTSVKSFGAKGDGVTNDTLSVQNILKSVNKNIFFPAGTYVITPPLVLDSTVYDKSITFDSQAKIIFTNTSAHGLHLNGCYNIDFVNLNIEHPGTGDFNALRIDNGSHHLNFLGRTKVYDSPMWAVNLRGGCHDIYMQYMDVDNTVKGITRSGGDGIDLHSCYNITIDQAIIKSGDDGLCIKSVGDNAVETHNITIGKVWAKAHGGAISFGSEIRQNCYNISVGQVVSFESLYAVYIRNDISGTGILYNVSIGQVTHYDRVGSTAWVMLAYSADDINRFKGIHINSIMGEAVAAWDLLELRNVKGIKIDHVHLTKYPCSGTRLFGTTTRNRFGLHFNKAKECYIGSGYVDCDAQAIYFYGAQDNHVKDVKAKTTSTTPLTFYGDNVTSTPSINNTVEMVDFTESAGTTIQTHTPAYVSSKLDNNKVIRLKGIVSEAIITATIPNGSNSITINHGLPTTPNIVFAWSISSDIVSVSAVTSTQITVMRTTTLGDRQVKISVSL